MHRTAISGSVLTVGLLYSAGTSAKAAAGDRPQLDERTTLMPIVERVSAGSDRPAWPARALLPMLAPNPHLELSILERPPAPSPVQSGGGVLALEDHGRAFSFWDSDDTGIRGQASVRAAQPGTIFEVPLTSIFSVTVLARYQLSTGWRHGAPDR